MGIAELLGVADIDGELLSIAARRWPHWVAEDARLGVVADLRGYIPWLRQAGPADADAVLHALATRAAFDGGDDPVAAATLAWGLLPGACTLAHRLQRLAPRIDELVAAQLWLEVRSFAWQRLDRVAANILLDTRAAVLRDCGAANQLRRSETTWYHTQLLDPDDTFWGALPATTTEKDPAATERIWDLLSWACDNEVISEADRGLLLSVLETADRFDLRYLRRWSGLLSNEVTEAVAQERGISPVTVRRHASRSIQALTHACADRGISA